MTEGVDAVFTVMLSATSTQTVTVNYGTADDSATSPADYTSLTSSLSLAPSQTVKTITVTTIDDSDEEDSETFTVTLSSPNNATLVKHIGYGTITDNDVTSDMGPTLSISDETAEEGNDAIFTVTLSQVSTENVTVNYATTDGTATEPADYVARSDLLTFLPNETVKTIAVTTIDDDLDERSEVFTMTLSSPSGATLKKHLGHGTITDNDGNNDNVVGDEENRRTKEANRRRIAQANRDHPAGDGPRHGLRRRQVPNRPGVLGYHLWRGHSLPRACRYPSRRPGPGRTRQAAIRSPSSRCSAGRRSCCR